MSSGEVVIKPSTVFTEGMLLSLTEGKREFLNLTPRLSSVPVQTHVPSKRHCLEVYEVLSVVSGVLRREEGLFGVDEDVLYPFLKPSTFKERGE